MDSQRHHEKGAGSSLQEDYLDFAPGQLRQEQDPLIEFQQDFPRNRHQQQGHSQH